MKQLGFELTKVKELDNSTGESVKIDTPRYNQAVILQVVSSFKIHVSDKVKKYDILFDLQYIWKCLYIHEMNTPTAALLVFAKH